MWPDETLIPLLHAGWPRRQRNEPLFPPPHKGTFPLPLPKSKSGKGWLSGGDEEETGGVFWYLGSRHDAVHEKFMSLPPDERPEPHPKWINPAKSGRVKVLCGKGGADGGGMTIEKAPPMSREVSGLML